MVKAKNKHGKPIKLQSKILAVLPDGSREARAVYIAEAAGDVKTVDLEVCKSIRVNDHGEARSLMFAD